MLKKQMLLSVVLLFVGFNAHHALAKENANGLSAFALKKDDGIYRASIVASHVASEYIPQVDGRAELVSKTRDVVHDISKQVMTGHLEDDKVAENISQGLGFLAGYVVHYMFSENTEDGVNRNATAFAINLQESKHAQAIKRGIPSTMRINGTDIELWLAGEREMNLDGVRVVEQLESGMFSDSKKLSEFDHMSLSESLQKQTCVLCSRFNKNTIVINAQGNPELMCRNFKKQDFPKRLKAELQMQREAREARNTASSK